MRDTDNTLAPLADVSTTVAMATDSPDDIAQCPVWDMLDASVDVNYPLRTWRNEDNVNFYVNPLYN